MNEALQQFVERMALICEKEGMARIGGRIFGLLLATGDTYSLDELAERLQASKASVSTNARMLEQFGMIQRVSVMGDRRDFYRAEQDPWEKMLRASQARWRDMLQVFDDALEGHPDDGACHRIREARQFHELLLDRCDRLVEEWRAMRRSGRTTAEQVPAQS
ncbi:MAG TPA: hypothetical protein VFQ45_12115 [Longimicrobium sp.]|nr:hypothetical protein [Longimicrobium sp.]